MTRIDYTGPDGVQSTERDEVRFSDGHVLGYDNPDEPGVENKIRIPTDRVIRVVGGGE